MDIHEFLPKYPNIDNSLESKLNPYEDGFYESIFKKKEFYDERLPEIENIPIEKGMLMKHQKIIARFLSSNTLYESLLLVHEMGSGKTCSAIGAIEQIKNEENNFKGAMIFAKGQGLIKNFVRELRDKCTGGQYIPDGFSDDVYKKGGLTELEVSIRTKTLIKDFYSTGTFETFAKTISKMKDEDIIKSYSNRVIVIDEVHNLRIQDDVVNTDRTKNTISIYKQFYRFLHLIKNCKILLLSGTPMKDKPEEIASVMNLILPKKLQLPTGDLFIDEYLNKQDTNKFTVKKNKIDSLKTRFKGRISFLKSMRSKVKKEFTGEKNIGKLKHFIVDTVNMSDFQTKYYMEAVKLDEGGKAGVHYNSRQASLMVFPDGSYGQPRIIGTNNPDILKGFGKYVKTITTSKTFSISSLKNKKPSSSFSLINELTDIIKGDTKKIILSKNTTDPHVYKKTIEKRLKNLSKFSIKYSSVIKSILEANGESCFVYSELVTGSGSIVFSQLLKLFGFTDATGNEDVPGLRYGFLTSFSTPSQIQKIIKCFNKPSNINGDIIKVIIGSKVVSEGVSFYNVQREYILTPWYNYSETDQAIARGYRLGSHKGLIEAGETPKVSISQIVAIPNNRNVDSIDLSMYEISEDKDITIRGILRYMMEASFDCALNYYRNHYNNEDGKRGCDYQECDYVCDGIDMRILNDGLSDQDVDKSTYQLYYSDPKTEAIQKDIEKYFRQHNNLSLDDVIRYFEGKYSESAIKNSLRTLLDKNSNMYYKDYVHIYSRSNVSKIINSISLFFVYRFRISFNELVKLLPLYSIFEILTALKNIIDESIVIKNKYGFSSYLRESHNIYFLVNNLSVSNDSFSDYYVKFPNILTDQTFYDILYNVQLKKLPELVNIICNNTKQETFTKLIKHIPPEVQELFIESAIESNIKEIKQNKTTRKFILDYFIPYIHQIKDTWVSNRLGEDDTIRCYKEGKWTDCDKDYTNLIDEKIKTIKSTLEENPWGYYGQYNPEKNIFSIVNVVSQKRKQEEVKENQRLKLLKSVKKGTISQDQMDEKLKNFVGGREIYPGKNCLQGWGITNLLKISIRHLKLDFPDDFRSDDSIENLKKLAKDTVYIGKRYKKDVPIYTEKEIDNLNREDLRRALYWSVKRNGGHIVNLCSSIKEWFRNKKWNGLDMLIPDKQAGMTGGHKKIDKKIMDNEPKFFIEKIVPYENKPKFEKYLKDNQTFINGCFNVKKYVPVIDDSTWIMIKARKKMIGFIVIDTNNIISNICLSTKYRRERISKQIIQVALKDVCTSKSPRMVIDNKGKEYDKLMQLYIGYGFTVVKNDSTITTIEFKCT
jgi:superfamily II DNA or RNA helicase